MRKFNYLENEVFLALQVIPRLKNGNNFELVDKVIDFVKSQNLPCQVSAMETTIRGNLSELLAIIKQVEKICFDEGALEVIINIKIHSKTQEATDTFCTYDRGVTKSNYMFMQNE